MSQNESSPNLSNFRPEFLPNPPRTGHTPRGSYSRKGVLLPSRCLLESPFLEPLLRTLLRTLLPIKTHCKTPSKNPSQNLLESNLENPSKNPSEKGALLHAPVGVRPTKLFEGFSCFASQETETANNSPKIPPFSLSNLQANSKNIHKHFLESRQSNSTIQGTARR